MASRLRRIEVDEAMFLGGLPKGEFLREFEPDFFFDDQTGHVEHAAGHVPAGLVTTPGRGRPSPGGAPNPTGETGSGSAR